MAKKRKKQNVQEIQARREARFREDRAWNEDNNQLMANRFMTFGFLAVISSLLLVFILTPSKGFSELENRYLQELPKFSLERILSKDFNDEFETYLADQFPMRDEWLEVKAKVEEMRLQKENNGIYKGKDGYLFEKFDEPDWDKIDRYLTAINKLASTNPEVRVTLMLVPNSIALNDDKLPAFAAYYPQEKVNAYVGKGLISEINYLNGFDFLGLSQAEKDELFSRLDLTDPVNEIADKEISDKETGNKETGNKETSDKETSGNKGNEKMLDSYLYFKTDHHWTTYGAYLAYLAYAESQGYPGRGLDEFRIERMAENYLGSFHSRGLFANLEGDNFDVMVPVRDQVVKLYVHDDESDYETWYFPDHLVKKDKFPYYYNGVHAWMSLSSQLEETEIRQDSLLVIKDSYAHNLLPFLALDIPEIDVLDMRFYSGRISSYITDHDVREILLVFNTGTFVEASEITRLGL